MLSEFQLFTANWRLAPSNHNVGSACASHLTLIITSGLRDANSLPLQIEYDDRKRTFYHVTHKNEATEAWKALQRALTWVSRGHRI